MPRAPSDTRTGRSLLAFGAHPDDIEFGCGGNVARETFRGRDAHFVVCSHGEAATHGTPETRAHEAARAAERLGATLEFVTLDGDGKLEVRAVHALKLAGVIRRVRPGIVLAPTLEERQHPDHFRLARLVADAARLARYGGVDELHPLPAHPIDALLHYAITADAEPAGAMPILVDISDAVVLAAWTDSMAAHGSQGATRPYAELQLARARVWGLRAGVGHAQGLYPHDPLVLKSLDAVRRTARHF